MEEKTCLNCGQPVGPGRKDKKYCTEACKTEYNNRQKEQQKESIAPAIPEFIAEINSILANNWRILTECLGSKETVRMRTTDLSGRGFNYKFYTSERFNKYNDDVYNFCYDMGYKVVEEGDDRKVVIVRNSDVVRLSGPAHP